MNTVLTSSLAFGLFLLGFQVCLIPETLVLPLLFQYNLLCWKREKKYIFSHSSFPVAPSTLQSPFHPPSKSSMTSGVVENCFWQVFIFSTWKEVERKIVSSSLRSAEMFEKGTLISFACFSHLLKAQPHGRNWAMPSLFINLSGETCWWNDGRLSQTAKYSQHSRFYRTTNTSGPVNDLWHIAVDGVIVLVCTLGM